MKMMFVCLIYASGAASVLFLLIREFKNAWRLYGILFLFFFIMSYIKLGIDYSGIFVSLMSVFLIGCTGLFTKKMLKKPFRYVAWLICLDMGISCLGDLIALLAVWDIFQYKVFPGWNDPEGLEAIIISNVAQVVLAAVYSWWMAKKQTEQKLVIGFTMLVQVLVLLWCLIFVKFQESKLSYMFYIFIAFQGILGALLFYWFWLLWKENDIRKKEERLTLLKEENKILYEHYQKKNESYKNLHKLNHDFNNLMNVACFMVQKGDLSKARQLFADMESLLKNAESERDCL